MNRPVDPRRWTPAVLICVVIALAVFVDVMARLAVHLYSRSEKSNSATPAGPEVSPPPPEPQRETHPMDNLNSLREKESSLLDRYAWIDRPKGVAQIPIERAMQLESERLK